MDNRIETLKFIFSQALTYTFINTMYEYSYLSEEYIKDNDLYKRVYETEVENEDDTTTIMFRNIDPALTANLKSDIMFDFRFVTLFSDANIIQVDIQLIGLVEVAGSELTVFISDILNMPLKNMFDVIGNVYYDYSEIGLNTDGNYIKFYEDMLLCYTVDAADGIQLSVKSIFLNDLPIYYDIEINDALIKEIAQYTASESDSYIQELIDNNQQNLQNLAQFGSSLFKINLRTFKKKFHNLLNCEPTNTEQLMKYMIANSVVRFGSATLSDLLALYDKTEFIKFNKVIYNFTLNKEETE